MILTIPGKLTSRGTKKSHSSFINAYGIGISLFWKQILILWEFVEMKNISHGEDCVILDTIIGLAGL